MSDSDDDLLALADVGSDSEEEISQPSPPSNEVVNPYPLEGKYLDAEDRAKLDALPEIEREEILYDRAQEMQRYEERRYLAQRRKQMTRVADEDEAPSAKRQRGTTGVSSGTKTSLEALKKRRAQQSRKSSRHGVDDDAYSDDDEDNESSSASGGSDIDSEDEEVRRSFRRRKTDEVEWADNDDDIAEEVISLSDINKIRWGKSLFARFSMMPGFADAVPGCFVRVNIGANRSGQPVYRLCQIKKAVTHRPYQLMDKMVDEAIVASMAGSERTLEFSICSDSPASQAEYEFWKTAMSEANLTLPSRRRAQFIFDNVRALSKRVLSSAEIDAMVERRTKLNGQRGANAILKKAELLHLREIAIDQNNTELIDELNRKLHLGPTLPGSDGANTSGNSAGRSHPEGGNSGGDSHLEKLLRVDVRNKRANVESVRKAEQQAQAERRKAGNQAKADPFSRLRTTAKIFYKSGQEPTADQSSAEAAAEIKQKSEKMAQLANVDTSLPLAAMDDLIARINIKLEIEI